MLSKFNSLKKLTVLLTVFTFLIACDSQEDIVAPSEPQLPPSESMMPDFSLFSEMSKQGATPEGGRVQTFLPNATIAYINYVVWNTLISIDMALPVAAFSNSFNHEAEYDAENEQWVWAYDVATGGDTYQAELTGKIGDSSFLWEMYASKKGDEDFQRVLWFSGTSDFDERGGSWTIYRDAKSPKEHLQIDWSKDEQSSFSIRFTSLDDAEGSGIPRGSYVEYLLDSSAEFDVLYNLFFVKNNDLPEDKLIEIRYNSASQEGGIRSMLDFKSEEWQCWNKQFEDVACN